MLLFKRLFLDGAQGQGGRAGDHSSSCAKAERDSSRGIRTTAITRLTLQEPNCVRLLALGEKKLSWASS